MKQKSFASQLVRNSSIAFASLVAFIALGSAAVQATTDATPATAPAVHAPVIGVVDVQKVVREATATVALQKKVETLQKELEAQALQDSKDWKQKQDDLQKKKAALSDAAFKEKSEELQKNYVAAQKSRSEKMGKVQQSLDQASEKVKTAVDGVLKRVAEKKSYSLLVNKSAVLYSTATLDATADVLSEMNASVLSIDVAVPDTK